MHMLWNPEYSFKDSVSINLTFQGEVVVRIQYQSQIRSGQYWDVCGL